MLGIYSLSYKHSVATKVRVERLDGVIAVYKDTSVYWQLEIIKVDSERLYGVINVCKDNTVCSRNMVML